MVVLIVLLFFFLIFVYFVYVKVKFIDSVIKKDMWGLVYFEYKSEWSLLLFNFVFKININ